MEPDTYESVSETAKTTLDALLDSLYEVGYSDGYTAGREAAQIVAALDAEAAQAPAQCPCGDPDCLLDEEEFETLVAPDLGCGCFCGDPECNGETQIPVNDTLALLDAFGQAVGFELDTVEECLSELLDRIEHLEYLAGIKYTGSNASEDGN